jgi:sugar/nucleoside kinase (ribokinase family)
VNVDLNIISHAVLDNKIFFTKDDKKEVKNQLGGPVSFASTIFPVLSIKGRCITTVGRDFPKEHLEYFSQIKNCHFEFDYSEKTTRFLHKIYEDFRFLYLLKQASNLDEYVTKFPGAKGCLISPVYHEVTSTTIEWACGEHDYIGVDVQGFMRGLDTNNKIILLYNPQLLSELTKNTSFVKYSLNEAQHYTQKRSYIDIMEGLPSHNTQIVTLGKEGLLFSNNERYYRLSAPSRIERDPTGAGDVLVSGILSKLVETDDLEMSIAFGMALAAEKVQLDRLQFLASKNYIEIAETILESLVRLE